MALFACTQCGHVDNTTLTNYWAMTTGLDDRGIRHPLCSLCDPDIGAWHGRFRRMHWRAYMRLARERGLQPILGLERNP